jgi:hypothetical protein
MHLFSIVTLFNHLVLCDDTSANEMLLIVQPFLKAIMTMLCWFCEIFIDKHCFVFSL